MDLRPNASQAAVLEHGQGQSAFTLSLPQVKEVKGDANITSDATMQNV